jgi:ankyrin repeat protein
MALAIQNGSYQTIKQLVDWGANVQEKDHNDYTYLHIAAVSGHVNIFLYFLSKKVPIHAKTKQGKTAIELAQSYKQDHLLKYLRDKFEAASVLQAIQPIDI